MKKNTVGIKHDVLFHVNVLEWGHQDKHNMEKGIKTKKV